MSHNPFEVAVDATKEIQSSVRQGGVPASALYEGVIRAAYMIQNNYNANQVDLALHIELPSGYEYKISKAVLRDGSPEVLNDKTKKKELMFTYVQMAHIIGAAIPGATMADVFPSIQEKPIELYNFEQRKDVLTNVKMVTDLVGKKLFIGLQRKIANKRQETDQTDDNGRKIWLDLPERKESLEFGVAASIEDSRTFTEITAGTTAENATDVKKWVKLNEGKDWMAYKEVAGASGVPASVAAGAAEAETVIDFTAS